MPQGESGVKGGVEQRKAELDARRGPEPESAPIDIMTPAELKHSAATATASDGPPSEASPAAQALWCCEAGRWDEAHAIAQDLHTPLGSWIHALLHLIEGDEWNAGYWFSRAGKPAVSRAEIAAEWEKIAVVALGEKVQGRRDFQ